MADYNSELPEGQNTYTIMDSYGCSLQDTFEISEVLLAIAAEQVTPSCNDEVNGSAFVEITEGNPTSFGFLWSNGQMNTELGTNLAPGWHTITMTNSYGCDIIDSVFIDQNFLSFSQSITDIDCHGSQNGAITINDVLAVPPYLFDWSNGSSENSISNLSPGIYSLTITDSTSCVDHFDFEIVEPLEISIEATINGDNPITSELEGQIEVTPFGGVPPFDYSWSNGGISNVISNLPVGEYGLTITDSNNCQFDTIFTLPLLTSNVFLPQESIKVFPNPATKKLILEFIPNIIEFEEIKIVSALGVEYEIVSQVIGDKVVVNLENLPSGAYHILVRENNILTQKKFLKIE